MIFNLFYLIILILLSPFMLKYYVKKSYREILKRRLFPQPLPDKRNKRIWFHAVSVGEVKSLSKLLSALNAEGIEIVLSVSTPSGYQLARTEYPRFHVIPAPLDFSFTVKRFNRTIEPDLLVLNELEVWPNWLKGTSKAGIPIILINGRISDSAFGKYRKFAFLFGRYLRLLKRVLVQDSEYKRRFAALGVPDAAIEICGNIKADEAMQRAAELPSPSDIRRKLQLDTLFGAKRKILCVASHHSSDEAVILPVLDSLAEQYHLIWVPRHPERCQEIQSRIEARDVAFHVWSRIEDQAEDISPGRPLLIYDRIGYLLHILSVSDIVIMGGTFDPGIGGHNLYEPAALGKAVFGGPHTNNFSEIANALKGENHYTVFESGLELTDALNSAGKNQQAEDCRKRIDIVRQRSGSLARIQKRLKEALK